MTVEELVAIEEIKHLKAIYFYTVDMKDWETIPTLFTADAEIDFSSEPEIAGQRESAAGSVVDSESWTFTGGSNYAAWLSSVLTGVVSIHNGHDPLITLVDDGSAAKGIWPMVDRLETKGEVFSGFGHYHDEYRRVDGRWLISKLVMVRMLAVWEPRDTVRLAPASTTRW